MVQRFPAIDCLRGFAAISVLVYHVIEHMNWTGFPIHGPLLWFRMGFFGVDLFFVISGFVVTHMALTLYEKDRSAFWFTFILSRLCRIAPLYLLTMAAYVGLVAPSIVHHPDFWRHLLMHLGFVHNWSYETYGSIDGPNWSVAVEMQFYLCLALALPLIMRFSLLYLLVGCIAITWLWKSAMTQIVDDGPMDGFHLNVLTSQLPGSLDLFGFGIALAYLVRTKRYKELSVKPWFAHACFLIAAASVMIALNIYWLDTEYWHNPLMVTTCRTPIALACMLVILAACQIRGIALRFLAPVQHLGTISYGIYLWHVIVLLCLKNIGATPAEALLGTLAGTLALSALSWHLLESPVVSAGRKWLSRSTLPAFRYQCRGANEQGA